MDRSQKWETVGSKRGGSAGKSASTMPVNTGKTSGLSHSSAPFSQFGERMDDEDAEKLQQEPTNPLLSSSATMVVDIPASQSQAKKRTTSKKTKQPKVKKVSFEECLASEELQPHEIERMVGEVKTKYEDKPMNILKEAHGHLGSVFSKAEPEKDYVFSTQPPGYPLSALPAKSKDALLKLVVQCPPLTQEAAFRYFFELLLSELSAGASSYGTRMMLLLLVQCNSSVCVETGNMIKIFLDSNISKVPEALSLLWVGLPHPRLHPITAVRTWPDLCFPLFQRANIPRQVFSYAVDYTCTLIRCVGERSAGMLLEALSPATLSSLLTSPQLQKRAQDNVHDMLELAQEAVLKNAPDKKLVKYFSVMFKNLSTENLLPAKFAARCLQNSGGSWEAWSNLGPSSQPGSIILLKELSGCDLTPPRISLDRLAGVLTKVSQKLPEKEKEMAKELLSRYAEVYEKEEVEREEGARQGTTGEHREEERGRWCSVCGVLVVLLSVLYLCCLCYFLYHIATQGPEATLKAIGGYVGVKDLQLAWRSTAFILNQYCAKLLEYVPQCMQIPEKLMQVVTDMTS